MALLQDTLLLAAVMLWQDQAEPLQTNAWPELQEVGGEAVVCAGRLVTALQSVGPPEAEMVPQLQFVPSKRSA
jgi:hypothetical protein